MYRVVLDTNIIEAALRSSDGASAELLRLAVSGKLKPLATPALFLEYEEVVKRPEQRLVHGLELEQLDEFLAALATVCEPVKLNYQWRPQLKDAADEMVLEAAINGRAQAIATFNMRDFQPAAGLFGLDILRPGEVLRSLRS